MPKGSGPESAEVAKPILRICERDRKLFQELLAGFVPPNAFDAHVHMYARAAGKHEPPAIVRDGPEQVNWQYYTETMSDWMGDRCPSNALVVPFPFRDIDLACVNHFVLDQASTRSGSKALRLLHPGESPDLIREDVTKNGYAGFKVYHLYAQRSDTFNAAIQEFVPEWLWEIADSFGLVILLHLVRSRALLDEANSEYIRSHCLRYPSARLILAHAARGFCSRHTIEGIGSLRGLDNVFFDTSAICESGALEAILRVFGPRRLLFGSDFPISQLRGRAVSVADRFLWLYEDSCDWHASKPEVEPTLVGIESLLALKQACGTLHLRDSDLELIFGDSARAVLNLDTSETLHSGQEAYRLAKQIIPGGGQLLSKRPEMFAPEQWPPYFAEARGVEIIDVEGRRFTDMTTAGIGTCLLGYSDPDVNAAVIRRITLGSASTLNSPEDLELAKLLVQLHPWAQMVRFGRGGGEALAIAVRIARAYTRRDLVACCGYHGWQDWYLAANLTQVPDQDPLADHLLRGLDPAGVPVALAGTTLTFKYNDRDEITRIVCEHGNRLAAIVMEPTRSIDPAPGFLESIRELADRCDAVLIFDELTSGWRLEKGGAHLRYGVSPDMAVFGKALGNGVPIAAVIGTGAVMQAAQSSFISSTMWTESLGPTAALATLRKMLAVDVPDHAGKIGYRYREGLVSLACRHRVPLKLSGHPALTFLQFEHPAALAIQTLMTVRMLNKKFLVAGGFYPSLAHTERHVDACLAALDEVFEEIARAIRNGDVEQRIGGPVRHSGFSRLA